ncbi:hypothetical protein VTH06DRAFT_2276 [Thermothelomyces fergusii]
MESFRSLKRRTAQIFYSLEPSIPSIPLLGGRRRSSAMKGTWEKLQIPPLPRSSHSADIVDGTLYIFGGEVEPRRPVDNDMHVITLPSSGAQADYYAVEAKPLDFLELGVDVFDDQVSRGEAVLCARGGWKSLLFGKEAGPAARPSLGGDSDYHDEEAGTTAARWPGARSVAGLEAVSVGGGREYLVLLFGERVASAAGHAGAGRFWDDVWAFQVPPEGMSLASVADTARSVVGGRTGEGTWTRLDLRPHDEEDDASADGPGPRGWIATAPMGQLEENGLVVFGGLDERNRRLGDGWILRLD